MKKEGFSTGLFMGMVAGMIIAIVMILVIPKACSATSATGSDVLDSATTEKLNNLSRIIESNYYEDVDTDDLRNGLYKGLFEGTGDIYSGYYTPEEYKTIESSTNGTFDGIGAMLTQDSTTKKVTVVSVYDDSPAKEAGLQADDIIIKADEYRADSMDLTEFVTHLRGESGTQIHVTVFRESENKTIEMDITRRAVEYTTALGTLLRDDIGYIRVSEFAESTVGQFDKALEDLEKQGATKFIIDLRRNPGGVLNSAVSLADRFLPEGVVVSTKNKNGEVKTYNSTKEHRECQLVVLVDSKSASASEVFAGAIRDYKAGTIIGNVTYGKGIVQAVRKMNDGSAYKLTIATYYTPSGENIHGVGITPDIEVDYKWDDSDDSRYDGENDYMRDSQLSKAIEVLEAAR